MSLEMELDEEESGLSSLSEVEEEEVEKESRVKTRITKEKQDKGKNKENTMNDLPKRRNNPARTPATRLAIDKATAIAKPSQASSKSADTGKQKARPANADGSEKQGHNGQAMSEDEQENFDAEVEELEELSESEESIPEDDDADQDFRAPYASGGRGTKRDRRGTAIKGRGLQRGAAASARPVRPRQKTKSTLGAQDLDAEADDADGEGRAATRVKDDFEIGLDNTLFNAVKDSRSALQGTVEDWIAQYQSDEDSRGSALAELITFFLRICGCKLSVDLHEAQDLDGVVNKLDEIQTDFAKVNQYFYPLISKSKDYKKFRSSLWEFMQRLIEATAVSEILFDDIFCETFQSWLVAASSSKLRAFRHTSTFIILLLVEALCETAVQVSDDFASIKRQKAAEETKKKTDKARLKELELRVKTMQVKKLKLEEYFKDIFEAVFVHRYRDAEASIRTECIRALGAWMKRNPDYFLQGNYLRYIGWVLTDLNKEVRLEAVQSLLSLYAKEDYINSMQHFTERFKSRLVEMAMSEYDLSVRVAAIYVLRAIDRHGLLEDKQRDEVARLIYDIEPRVRKAGGEFFAILLDEEVEKRKVDLETVEAFTSANLAKNRNQEDLQIRRLGLKCLARLLVKFQDQLDDHFVRAGTQEDETEDCENTDRGASTSKKFRADAILRSGNGAASTLQLAALLQGQQKDRISMAVESLWSNIEILQDWQAILDYLLLDHSASEVRGSESANIINRSGDRGQSDDRLPLDQAQDEQVEAEPPRPKGSDYVEESCRLLDQEETILLDAFVASIHTTRHRASLLAKKDEAQRDDILHSITRALINALPCLFTKHQTDATRSLILLLLPRYLDLQLYVDMRLGSWFESLWDDITKQFFKHSDVFLLEQSMETIRVLINEVTLVKINNEKIAALERAVIAPLKEVAADLNLEDGLLDDEQTFAITNAMTRLALLCKSWDVVALLDEKESTTSISIISIAQSIVERGQNGFQNEDKMVQRSLEILYFYYLWKITKLPADAIAPKTLLDIRNLLVDRATDLALGRLSNASEVIKRAAFKLLLDLRIVSKARHSMTNNSNDLVEMSIETQYRCAGFIQAEVERYAAGLSEHSEEVDDIMQETVEDDSDLEDSENEIGGKRGKIDQPKKPKGTDVTKVAGKTKPYRPLTLAQHADEYGFNDLIASFSRAICTDVIDLHHASTILIHYGRFGAFYDECGKWLGDALKHFGVFGDEAHAAAGVVVESLKGASDLYLKTAAKSDNQFVNLARHLANHIVVRGRGFAITGRLPSKDLLNLHTEVLTYAVKKAAIFESQEKTASRNKVLGVFKALNLCILGMTGKEAQVIHAHMKKTLKESAIVPSIVSKPWEAQRNYAKKLVSLMSKDGNIRAAARQQAKKIGHSDSVVSDLEGGDTDGNQENDGSQTLHARKRPRAKPSAGARKQKERRDNDLVLLPTRRSGRASNISVPSLYEDPDSDVDEEANEAGQQTKTKARRGRSDLVKAKPQRESKSNSIPTMDLDTEPENSDLDDLSSLPTQDLDGGPQLIFTPPMEDVVADGHHEQNARDLVLSHTLQQMPMGKNDKRKTRMSELDPPSSPNVSVFKKAPTASSAIMSHMPVKGPLVPIVAIVPTEDLSPALISLSPSVTDSRDDDADSLADIPDSPPEYPSQMSPAPENGSPARKKRRSRY